LACSRLPQDQDGPGVLDGGAGQIALVKIRAEPGGLLGLADDFGGALLLEALERRPVAPLATQEKAEGMAQGRGIRAQEREVRGRVRTGAGGSLEVQHGQDRARPRIRDGRTKDRVGPPGERAGLRGVPTLELRALDELPLLRLRGRSGARLAACSHYRSRGRG